MKSIIQKDLNRCYICGVYGTEKHHVIFGSANRKKADKYGLIVGLCYTHHRSEIGVHGREGKGINLELKKQAQTAFEQRYSHDEYMRVFGKSYL